MVKFKTLLRIQDKYKHLVNDGGRDHENLRPMSSVEVHEDAISYLLYLVIIFVNDITNTYITCTVDESCGSGGLAISLAVTTKL